MNNEKLITTPTEYCICIILEVQFRRTVAREPSDEINDNNTEISTFYLQSPMKQLTPTTRIGEWFDSNIRNVIVTKVDELQGLGSGLTLHRIVQLDVNFNKHNHFSGSSYIPLPKSIRNKTAVVNVQNEDNQCFKWAILSKIHEAPNHRERLLNYERFKHELNFDGIEFPVAVQDIDKFETLNPDISVNVYMIEKDRNINSGRYENMILPLRLTKKVKSQHVHLLLLFESDVDDDGDDDSEYEQQTHKMNMVLRKEKLCNKLLKNHYVWIRNLSGLIQSQVVKSNRNKKHICDRCLHYFYSEEKLNVHKVACEELNSCKISLPNRENRWLYFENFKNKIEVPFIIYADIESLLVDKTPNENNVAPKGTLKQHIPNAVGYYFHSRLNPGLSHYDSFTGENCVEKFIERLKELMVTIVWDELHSLKPMRLSVREEGDFQRANKCHICEKNFFKIKPDIIVKTCRVENVDQNIENSLMKNYREMRKVRDHCHLTGKFRGAAHSTCNMKFQISKTVPIVFHNLDYDSHFLIEKLANAFDGKMNIIPKTSENYISFTKEIPKENFKNDGSDINNDSHDNPKSL